ncbi:MAG: insulysin [Bacillariaceae sp.]
MFTSSGTEREVQAVSSENSKNLTADGRRRLQILKDLVDPNHYYSKFSTGNSETLPTDDPEKLNNIREALLAFHRKHYKPEKMTVVIAGPQSIETLEEWVSSRYSQIESNNKKDSNNEDDEKKDESVTTTTTTITRSEVEELVAAAANDAPPYGFEEAAPVYNPPFKASTSYYPILLTTKPLRSMRKLVLMFPIPSDRKTPDRSPSSMLSHLLGHEGPGSAFATLQNKGLLSSLSAGPRTSGPDFTIFQVDMGLTEKGEKHWEDVVHTIFAYCRLLKGKATGKLDDSDSGGVDDLKRIWKEMSELDQIFFDQSSPGGAYGYVPNLADRVVSLGTETCLSAGSMLNENEDTFPLDDFTKIVKLLTPENCIIERSSEGAYEAMQQQQKGDGFEEGFGLKKEKWYGVEYFLSSIEDKHVSTWKGVEVGTSLPTDSNSMDTKELSLPSPNRYIPRTLELCPDLPEDAMKGQRIEKSIEPPSLLVNEERWKLFHRLDDRYALPKSSLHLLIRNMSLQNIKSSDGGWDYDSKSSLLSSFLAGMFNEAMAQETYDADLAGSHWSVSIGSTGIKLTCFGFSDRLPDLALKVLDDFLSGEFMSEKFFISSRDRAARGLRTYFESRRADSHAMYYRDSLLGSLGQGVDESLKLVLASTFDDVKHHHQRILQDNQISVSCLLSGNVSSKEATEFFSCAKSKIKSACNIQEEESGEPIVDSGIIERQLQQGQEVELHFSSKNTEEENGAVLCTYQSSIPSFKGAKLSHPLGLESSSAIRLLSHILREPLFDSLRTKQQLGYIVSSYYEIGISSQSNANGLAPATTPVDFICINVLSQKMSPPDIADRIDEFLQDFRKQLIEMPDSEIQDHADSLSIKLLKPIQKLQSEASTQYSRIQRYGPEVFHRAKATSSSDEDEIPWDTTQALASTIRGLNREDLLKTFDRMTHPSTRSRIVSCVYGTKFPLKSSRKFLATSIGASSSLFSSLIPRGYGGKTIATTKIVNSFSDLLKFRTTLPNFNPYSVSTTTVTTGYSGDVTNGLFSLLRQRKYMVGIGVMGATILGWAMVNHRSSKPTGKNNARN